MSITIRKATKEDCVDISRCNETNLPLHYTPYDYSIMAVSNEYVVGVATFGFKEHTVGYIVGQITEKNVHILSFGVDEQFRRMKIGSQLLNFVENKVKGICEEISLYVHLDNKTAIQFYEKYGFKIDEHLIDYYEGNLENVTTQDAYKMIKTIL